jgi:hypothetical protein
MPASAFSLTSSPVKPKQATGGKPSLRDLPGGLAEAGFLKKFRARVDMEYCPAEQDNAKVSIVLPCPATIDGDEVKDVVVSIDAFFTIVGQVKLETEEEPVEDKDLKRAQDLVVHYLKQENVPVEDWKIDNQVLNLCRRIRELETVREAIAAKAEAMIHGTATQGGRHLIDMLDEQAGLHFKWLTDHLKIAANVKKTTGKEADSKPEGAIRWFRDLLEKVAKDPDELEKPIEELLWPTKSTNQHFTMTLEEIAKTQPLWWCTELKRALTPEFWRDLKGSIREGASEEMPVKGDELFGSLLGKAVIIPPLPGYTVCPAYSPSDCKGAFGGLQIMASYLARLHQGKSISDFGSFEGGNWLLPLAATSPEVANLDASSTRDQINLVAKEIATKPTAINTMKAAIRDGTVTRRSGRLVNDGTGMNLLEWIKDRYECELPEFQKLRTTEPKVRIPAPRPAPAVLELTETERKKFFPTAKGKGTPEGSTLMGLAKRITSQPQVVQKWFIDHNWQTWARGKTAKLLKKLENPACADSKIKFFVLRNHEELVPTTGEDPVLAFMHASGIVHD